MPAKYVKRDPVENGYFHVYNKGASHKIIFQDDLDYKTFLGFLEDYLTSPNNLNNNKKSFTINGKTYYGIPHKTKNYIDSIHLIAYNLSPNHFHLLLYRTKKKALEEFMRSISTRYSMYFNKKYNNSGPVFNGPYKSVCIDGISGLIYLSRYLHRDCPEQVRQTGNLYTSYSIYLDDNISKLIKKDIILSHFNNKENNNQDKIIKYKNFVEKYKLNIQEEKLLEGLTIETYLELPKKQTNTFDQDVVDKIENNINKDSLEGSKPKDKPYKKEKISQKQIQRSVFSQTFAFVTIYIVLYSIGFKNVLSYRTNQVTSIYSVSSNILNNIKGYVIDATNYTSNQLKSVNVGSSFLNDIKTKVGVIYDQYITKDSNSGTYTSFDNNSSQVQTSPYPLPQVAGINSDIEKTNITVITENKSNNVSIYSEPSTNSNVIDIAISGDTLVSFGKVGFDWYQIQLSSDSIGYIQSKFIKE
jgi:hypothetical protein